MAWPASISHLLPGHHSTGTVRLAHSRIGVRDSGGGAGGRIIRSHHAGWLPGRIYVICALPGCNLPGEDLGWSLPGADASEAIRRYEGRLVARTPGGAVDPQHCWLHPVCWRADPSGCGLRRFGSVFLATLSGIETCDDGLRRERVRLSSDFAGPRRSIQFGWWW